MNVVCDVLNQASVGLSRGTHKPISGSLKGNLGRRRQHRDTGVSTQSIPGVDLRSGDERQ